MKSDFEPWQYAKGKLKIKRIKRDSLSAKCVQYQINIPWTQIHTTYSIVLPG